MDTRSIKRYFEEEIEGNKTIQKANISDFLHNHPLKTLEGRNFENQLYNLRIKINNEKKLYNEKVVRRFRMKR